MVYVLYYIVSVLVEYFNEKSFETPAIKIFYVFMFNAIYVFSRKQKKKNLIQNK